MRNTVSMRRAGAVFAAASLLVAGLPAITQANPSDMAPMQTTDGPVFISEIHYDNVGVDVGEAIEVTAPVGSDLTGWSVVLYNGNGGGTYGLQQQLGVVPEAGVIVLDYPQDGLQNGSPDGMALIDDEDSVVEFLSYEGTFTATNGPATGLMSTDIGVAEASNTPIGYSLQKINGVWTGPAEHTFGIANDAEPVDQPPVASCAATLVAPFGLGASTNVSATDDQDAIGAIEIISTPVAGITLQDVDLAGGSAVLTVAADTAPGAYAVQIRFSTDADEPQTVDCTVDVSVESAPDEITLISTVQGAGEQSPLVGQTVTVEGIVTSLFTNNDAPDGFFLQEEDADADDDPNTSEGVFIFCRGQCPDPDALAVGDLVQVRGLVNEYFGMTQISSNASGGAISVISSGNDLPTPVELSLPAGGSTKDAATFEATEGMIVSFPDTLVVSEYFELARYGQLVLTADERPHQFTHTHAPDPAGYAAFLADLETRRIILDDDNNNQNDAVTGPEDNEAYPWPQGGLSVDNRVRGGDTIDGLTAVLHYSFAGQPGTDAWRLRPIDGVDYSFTSVNPAPAQPEDVGGSLSVVSYNVLNYFATIDETSSSSSGPCGPSGDMDCRGADSEQERQRQLTKIVAGLSAIDADIAGLLEIENDEGLATNQIVDALNQIHGPGTYAAVETGYIGTDAIKNALIYQPGSVTPVGDHVLLDSSVDDRFLDHRNRPVLIQTFEENATGERFTIAVNHLKSKGSSCEADGDPDRGDGQGNCAGVRTAAVQALADFLATDPTGSGDEDFLIVGDLNAYAKEDPITALTAAGYTDLHAHFEGPEAYSYVFDGQLGYLDTALANESLMTQVTGTTSWAINADEVPLFDYNDDIHDVGEASFDRKSSALPLYAPDALRSSDHDPVIVGLQLQTEVEEPTPQEALDELQLMLKGMKINPLAKALLTLELRLAQAALDMGKPAAACAILKAFELSVKVLQGRTIAAPDAAALREQSAEVRRLLGC